VEEKPLAGKNTTAWALRGSGAKGEMRSLLKSLGVLNNKHIPEQYLSGSISQRMDLLKGLMDTDGHCNTRGTASFASKREALAHQVMELATTLALRPRFFVVNATINGEPYTSWRVMFQSHSDRPAFILDRKKNRAIQPSLHRLTNKIVSIEETESVDTSCIQVEGGMYLVGKDLIPTHNSTVITFAGSIFQILNDPEITIGIFSFNRPIAKSFLRQIKWQFERNEKLKELYPEILYAEPEKEALKWSEDDGIIVKRNGMPKESTVEAWGLVDGQPTGRHFRCLVYDDVVSVNSVTTPEMIQKVTEALSISFNLGSDMGGVRRFVGTRYHYADTYATLIARGAVKVRLYSATKDGKTDGEPWLWTKEVLARKISDMGPYISSCQLFNSPVQEGEETFREEWIRYWIPRAEFYHKLNTYILVDPANEKKETSDYTVFMVIGLGSDHNYYLIDMVRDRMSLSERTNRLFSLHAEYRPISVGYEKYGMQSDVSHIEGEQETRQYRFPVIPLGGNTRKNDRIKRLQPIFQAGRFYIPEKLMRVDQKGVTHDLIAEFKQDEYFQFPYMTHDDMLDCMARIMEVDMQTFFPQPRGDDSDLPSWAEQTSEKEYNYDTYSYLDQ